jgi:type IV secretion system protein VirB5
MKRLLIGLFAVCFFGVVATESKAQIPVTDVAHITTNQINHLIEMIEWYAQIEHMLTQIDQLDDQINAMTGVRGTGGWNRDSTYQGIPTNWQETLNMMERPDALGQRTRDVREEARFIQADEIEFLFDSTGEVHELRAGQAASHQAANAELYNRAAERVDNLNALLDRVNTTTDVKESSDLVARIVGEQTLLTNELVMLMARAEVLRGQMLLDEATDAEASMRTRIPDGSWPVFQSPFQGD